MAKDEEKVVTTIILAAGPSSRMGQSKQLLLANGEALLRLVTRVSCESNATHTLVVLGQNERIHGRIIRDLPVFNCIHSEWEKGMGSSLKAGMEFVGHFLPKTHAVIVLVGDQPLITPDHVNQLIETYRTGSPTIVASAYADILGVPALFDAAHFKSLQAVDDAHGARQVIEQHKATAASVEFAGGSVDLDTPEDYQRYQDSLRVQEEVRRA